MRGGSMTDYDPMAPSPISSRRWSPYSSVGRGLVAAVALIAASRSAGYAIVGVAILLAMWARVGQAGFQHKQTTVELWKLRSGREVPKIQSEGVGTRRFDPPIDMEGNPEKFSW